jgi:hypothetical protein
VTLLKLGASARNLFETFAKMTFIGSFGSFGSFAACSSKGTGVPQPFDSCKPNVS